MPSSTSAHDSVGRLYAQALIELSLEQQQLDAVAEELGGLAGLIESENDLRRLIENPILDRGQRRGMIERLFEGKVSDTLYQFLQVVNQKDRLAALPAIVEAFAQMIAERRNEADVDAYVAAPLDQATADRVAQGLGAALGKTITLHQHVDPALIGGLKLRIGDQLVDASVAGQLRAMEKQLIDAGREKARQLAAASPE